MNKKVKQKIAFTIFRILGIFVVGILFVILGFIICKGIRVISWRFLTSVPTNGMVDGGIFPAIIGTIYLVIGSLLFAFPLGVMSGVYINEYAGEGKIISFIRVITNSLSGTPSIIFGLFGMSLFVNFFKFGDSLIAGVLTLGLLILPLIIRTTEEALKSVPYSYRIGSLALGASKLQTIRKIIIPIAFPNIITGLILSIGRISGETAPILFTAVTYFSTKLPSSIFCPVMALPYHLYVIATSGTNVESSCSIAYGTALVLITIVFFTNLMANILRKSVSKKVKN